VEPSPTLRDRANHPSAGVVVAAPNRFSPDTLDQAEFVDWNQEPF
jgi:hypothetical protein